MTPTRSRLMTALPVLAVIASVYPARGIDEITAGEAPVDVSQSAQSPSAGKAALAPEERQFLEAAAEFNVTGIAMANLASRHANSVAVDTLSQHLRREHSLSLAAVREIARAKGVALAEKRSAAHDASIAALALVTGRAFDEGYRKLVISLQEQAIRSFFAAMRAARDRDIRNFAEQNFGELRLQRAGFGATPVIVQGEVAARLVPPAPLLAFRIPASDGSTDPRLSTEVIPPLVLASRKEALCFAAASITGSGPAMMAGVAASTPRWRAFGAPGLSSAAIAENSADQAEVDESGKPRRKSSGTASRSGRTKAKPDSGTTALAPVAEPPRRTFFLFGRRSSPPKTQKSKGALASETQGAAKPPPKPFRLFGP